MVVVVVVVVAVVVVIVVVVVVVVVVVAVVVVIVFIVVVVVVVVVGVALLPHVSTFLIELRSILLVSAITIPFRRKNVTSASDEVETNVWRLLSQV